MQYYVLSGDNLQFLKDYYKRYKTYRGINEADRAEFYRTWNKSSINNKTKSVMARRNVTRTKSGVRQRKIGSRLITGPYKNKKGNDVYFLSAKGTSDGARVTIYKTHKSSAKGKYGMIAKGTSYVHYHSNNKLTLLRKIVGMKM